MTEIHSSHMRQEARCSLKVDNTGFKETDCGVCVCACADPA